MQTEFMPMYNPDREYFFFVFFFFTVPCAIAVCNPDLKVSIWMRLTAMSTFLLGLFVIIRVFVFRIPEYKIFVF